MNSLISVLEKSSSEVSNNTDQGDLENFQTDIFLGYLPYVTWVRPSCWWRSTLGDMAAGGTPHWVIWLLGALHIG